VRRTRLPVLRLPTDLMRTSDKVRALRRAGMQIGAHTVSHPILATPDRATAYSEIAISKHVLENLLGERVSLLANTDVFQLAGLRAMLWTHEHHIREPLLQGTGVPFFTCEVYCQLATITGVSAAA